MSRYVQDFKEVLKDYQEVFDIYYCDDEDTANRFFYTKEFPDIIPYVVLIDPKKIEPLKGEAGKKDHMRENNNFYYAKYRQLIFFDKIKKHLKKFINDFLDEKGVTHFY